jgi:PhzF family phenazine biosynthesis protein
MRPFSLVDVFGSGPFSGNPLAVVAVAEGLATDEMLTITRWLNLSETTFLLPPTDPSADYRVRIFTPDRELPFAGHPTLGSCHVWLEQGGQPANAGEIVQECGAGLVRLRRDGDRLAFAAPPLLRSGPVDEADLADVCEVLGVGRDDIVEAQWADNGPGWIGVRLSSAEAVLALKPLGTFRRRMDIGVIGLHAQGEVAVEIRAIFSDQTGALREDPVTGSLNASVAQWLLGSGLVTAPYVAAQGTCLDRQGRIYVSQDRAGIWIGGRSATLFSGSMAD